MGLFKQIDVNKLLQKLSVKKIVIVGQFLVIIFCLRTCQLKELSINNQGLQLKTYEGKINEFEKKTNKLGQEVNLQSQLVMQRDKDLEKALLKNSDLTKLNEQVKFEAQTTIKRIQAEYSGNSGTEVVVVHDTIRIDGRDSVITTEAVKVGSKFRADTSQWYKIIGRVGNKGIMFDTVSFKSDFTMNIGEKRVKGVKGWLLGKKEPKVELINANPYTKVESMKNIKFVDKKWYDNGWFKFGAGVLAGGLLIMGIR